MTSVDRASLLVLDTNVLVRVVRGDAVGNQILGDHSLLTRTDRPLISIVTLGEIGSLAEKFGWGERKKGVLRELLQELVVVQLGQGAIVQKYAQIDHHCEKIIKPARPMAQNDMWIAATASATGATLLTTDSDFDHLDPSFLTRVRFDVMTGKLI